MCAGGQEIGSGWLSNRAYPRRGLLGAAREKHRRDREQDAHAHAQTGLLREGHNLFCVLCACVLALRYWAGGRAGCTGVL